MKGFDMRTVLLVLGAAVLLLILDRAIRISPFLERQGFASGGGAPQRCGVDLDACPHPTRCINGYCRSQNEPPLVDRNPLPVVP